MTPPRPDRAFRLLFRAAAVYNLVFLLWTALAPGQFFRWIGVAGAEPFHWLWQCLGMVVGVYALAYWRVASDLESGRTIVLVGLLGKVLGPLGWVWHVARGNLPAASFLLILCNDLVWWPGFAAYLLRRADARRTWYRLLAWGMLATHAGGALLLLAVAAPVVGLVSGDPARQGVWTLAWALWCLGDILSPPFVFETLRRRVPMLADRAIGRLVRILIVLAAGGDLVLNAAYASVVAAPPPGAGPVEDPALRFLSLTVTNGLFLLCYLALSAALRRSVPRWLSLLGLPAWVGAAGLCLNGLGLLLPASLAFGGVFSVFFALWLIGLVASDRG